MIIREDRNQITMRAWDKWHAHFRQEALQKFMVETFLKYGWRHRVVAEPNTDPPILTGKMAITYCREIEKLACQFPASEHFQPVPTIQITEETTAPTIHEAFVLGVKVAKIYPRYVTTGSEHGVVDYTKTYPALEMAQDKKVIVQFHPEHPSYGVMGRKKESAFRSILDDIRRRFPDLKISVEHVSSADMVMWVMDQPQNVGAGITVQHIYLTADDLSGYSKRSKGLVCVHDGAFKPGAKDPQDREAVCEAALSGNPKFWSADDDAWHLRSKKECARSACGAANTIAAPSMLLSFFEENGKLEAAEPFLSEFGAKFYGFELNKETVTFVREEWIVPEEIPIPKLKDSVIPWFAGETMQWKLVG